MATWLKKHRESADLTQQALATACNADLKTLQRWERCENKRLLSDNDYLRLAGALDLEVGAEKILKRDHQFDLQLRNAQLISANTAQIERAIKQCPSEDFVCSLFEHLDVDNFADAAKMIAENLVKGVDGCSEDYLRQTFSGLFESYIPKTSDLETLKAYDHLVAVLAANCMVPDDSIRKPGECVVHGSTSAAMKRLQIDASIGQPMTATQPKTDASLDETTALAVVVTGDHLEMDKQERCRILVKRLVETVNYDGGKISETEAPWAAFEAYCKKFSSKYLYNRSFSELHSFFLMLQEEPDDTKQLLAELLNDARILQHSGECLLNPLARVQDEDKLEGWVAMWRRRIKQAKQGASMKSSRSQHRLGTPAAGVVIHNCNDVAVAASHSGNAQIGDHYENYPVEVIDNLETLKALIDPEEPGHLALEAALNRIEKGDPQPKKLLTNAVKGIELTDKVAKTVQTLLSLLG